MSKHQISNRNQIFSSNLTDDISKELDELLTRKEKYLDKATKTEEVTDDLLDFIDSTLYRDGADE